MEFQKYAFAVTIGRSRDTANVWVLVAFAAESQNTHFLSGGCHWVAIAQISDVNYNTHFFPTRSRKKSVFRAELQNPHFLSGGVSLGWDSANFRRRL